jgi:hypothetical protein
MARERTQGLRAVRKLILIRAAGRGCAGMALTAAGSLVDRLFFSSFVSSGVRILDQVAQLGLRVRGNVPETTVRHPEKLPPTPPLFVPRQLPLRTFTSPARTLEVGESHVQFHLSACNRSVPLRPPTPLHPLTSTFRGRHPIQVPINKQLSLDCLVTMR